MRLRTWPETDWSTERDYRKCWIGLFGRPIRNQPYPSANDDDADDSDGVMMCVFGERVPHSTSPARVQI